MFKSIGKKLAVVISSLALLVVPVMVPALASAEDNQINEGLKCGSTLSTNTSGCTVTEGSSKIGSTIKLVINVFSAIVGIISVIMIIFGGFKYITSGGDSSNVGAAKNTILFAVVGLIIVGLAQFIVQFVLDRVVNSTS